MASSASSRRPCPELQLPFVPLCYFYQPPNCIVRRFTLSEKTYIMSVLSNHLAIYFFFLNTHMGKWPSLARPPRRGSPQGKNRPQGKKRKKPKGWAGSRRNRTQNPDRANIRGRSSAACVCNVGERPTPSQGRAGRPAAVAAGKRGEGKAGEETC